MEDTSITLNSKLVFNSCFFKGSTLIVQNSMCSEKEKIKSLKDIGQFVMIHYGGGIRLKM